MDVFKLANFQFFKLVVFFGCLLTASAAQAIDVLTPKLLETQVVIVGGGASGVMAGIQAARMGVRAVVVEETPWLGGMLTAAGVSAADGNHNLPSGLWGEFRQELIKWYGGEKNISTGWVSSTMFEPHVGARILRNMATREKNLLILTETRYTDVIRTNMGWIVTAINLNAEKLFIKANILIDATELGDVAAKIGVPFDVGMDARNTFSERIAPEKANNIVQDLTYVAVLKDFGKDADRSIPRPASYDSTQFLCACKQFCNDPKATRQHDCAKMITYGELPNKKYMLNWPIHGNDYYVNLIGMTESQRKEAIQKAKEQTLNYVYFIQKELGYKHLGLADDEFPTDDKLALIPYHRESRRMFGMVTLNLNHMERPFDQATKLYRTGIAVGDYPVDQHHGKNTNAPDLYFVPIPSFNVPLGSLVPQNFRNLIIAEKSISVSNIANGATRLQPVVTQIGQAAGALAALAIKDKTTPDSIPVRKVQEAMLKSGGYLMPYLDAKPTEKIFYSIQRIGATGILKGVGKNIGWSNQTWFYMDSTLSVGEFWRGLKEFEGKFRYKPKDDKAKLSVEEALMMIFELDKVADSPLFSFNFYDSYKEFVKARWTTDYLLPNFDLSRPITRGELAVLLDKLYDPFHLKSVDWEGNFE
ncbi:MAG: FAD-dependent oxidoreductase [Spirosomataceae bacterium]